MKKSLRTVSVMMALLLGIQLLPMDILANAVSTQTETAIEVQNPITGECKELRDEYTKVYRREDGSQIAVIAPEAIHYIKDGKFADIDNTLIESSKSGHKVLTNKDNPFSIELPVTLNKDEKIKVTGDGYTLCL